MIYVDFNGRCGDQFFQYAFARKIQLKISDQNPLQFNFYNQERWRKKINDESFRNDLQFFNVVNNNSFVNEKNNFERFSAAKQKKLFKKYIFIKKVAYRTKLKFLAKHYQKKIQKNGIYYDDEYFELYAFPKKNTDVFIRGYFENYKYYYNDEKLRDALLIELTPKKRTLSEDDSLYNYILSHECTCVSLRSWGEVKGNKNTFTSRMVCGEEYYKSALEKMKRTHPDATFVIFSDNIEWAKKVIGEKYPALYESGNNTICEKIVLMSSCKHFIIANSSFSWWTQYLSNNSNKDVISPNRWYTDNSDTRVINKDWIIIEA